MTEIANIEMATRTLTQKHPEEFNVKHPHTKKSDIKEATVFPLCPQKGTPTTKQAPPDQEQEQV